ncbi:hypothetical protein NIA69_00795 [Gemmiger formicilis]|nr:hypothetical protein [Gemmiger formicilis]
MAKPGKPQQGSAVKVVEALVRPVVEGWTCACGMSALKRKARTGSCAC